MELLFRASQPADHHFVHPEDDENIAYWANKWGVGARELQEAILTTGTLRAVSLKHYLMRDSWLHHPVVKTRELLRNTCRILF